RTLVANRPDNGMMMVIAFDKKAETVQPFTADAAMLNRAIDAIQPTDGRSDISEAYKLADARLKVLPEQSRTDKEFDVRIFSDGRLVEQERAVLEGNPTFEKIGTDTAANVAIVALSARRNYDVPTKVQVFARLANYGPEPVEVPVQLSVDGEELTAGTARADRLFLCPDRWLSVPAKDQPPERAALLARHRDGVDFRLDLPRGAVVRLEQMLKQGDVLASDDVATIVVPPPKAMSVLVVTDGDGHFITKALRALPVKPPDVVAPRTFEATGARGYDVVIFNNYKPKAVPDAGNFIWFNALPDAGTRTKGAPAATRPAAGAGQLKDVFVLDWKRDHPIVEDLALGQLYFAKALRLTAPRDVEVLVEGYEQANRVANPLIVLERNRQATHLICGFDPLLSDWPLDKPSWPVFLYQALQYLAVGAQMEVRQTLVPGETVRVDMAAWKQLPAGVTKVRVTGPGGWSREVPLPDDKGLKPDQYGQLEAPTLVLPSMDRVGVYKTDPPVPGYEQVAVNLLDANESNTLPYDHVPGAVATSPGEATAARESRVELWWWLAVAALGMLMVEWWVYTRRVHL
ncbi:MAG TPA: VWA domain-containing protein, partial [Humisphaera sp.]